MAIAIIVAVVLLVQPSQRDITVAPAASATSTSGIAERPFELGPADAKVVVEEYGDYQCPYCKLWDEQVQPQIISNYIKAGKSVKLVFRPFPFLDQGRSTQESHLALQGAYCAADQNRFWDYHNALYSNQPQGENTGFWTTTRLKSLAQSLGLNTSTFNSCLDSGKYKAKTQ